MGRHKKSYELARSAVKTLILLVALILPAKVFASDILVLTVKDTISPPVSSYLVEHIEKAAKDRANAVIIKIDTPGGLDTSMRDIIQTEMNANIPVIVYVSPKGARAASAGAIICLAADITAMAPGTNLGAAHPVGIGAIGGGGKEGEDKTMTSKVTNDAVAYAKSIAKERRRNIQWAEDAVRNSSSIPAHEALQQNVIDLMADNIDDLLIKLDGKKIKKGTNEFTILTKNVKVVEIPMNFRARLLSIISNPHIAYILMLIGLAGLYFELSSPGAILPGIIGGISLILAFFAFQALPVNYAGVALILLAVIMFIAEIKVPSYGLLTVGGIISMLLGSLLLFRTPELSMQVSLSIILPITIFFAAFFAGCVWLVVKAHKGKPVTGTLAMIGESGEVYEWSTDGTGKVFTHGEYWNAKGPIDLNPGDSVEIEDVIDFTVQVTPKKK